jgi:dTMP kinase
VANRDSAARADRQIFALPVVLQLVQRNLSKNQALDYWESGMDLGFSRDMFDSFLKYQALLAKQFQRLQATYGFTILDGSRSIEEINAELRQKIESVLAGKTASRV